MCSCVCEIFIIIPLVESNEIKSIWSSSDQRIPEAHQTLSSFMKWFLRQIAHNFGFSLWNKVTKSENLEFHSDYEHNQVHIEDNKICCMSK